MSLAERVVPILLQHLCEEESTKKSIGDSIEDSVKDRIDLLARLAPTSQRIYDIVTSTLYRTIKLGGNGERFIAGLTWPHPVRQTPYHHNRHLVFGDRSLSTNGMRALDKFYQRMDKSGPTTFSLSSLCIRDTHWISTMGDDPEFDECSTIDVGGPAFLHIFHTKGTVCLQAELTPLVVDQQKTRERQQQVADLPGGVPPVRLWDLLIDDRLQNIDVSCFSSLEVIGCQRTLYTHKNDSDDDSDDDSDKCPMDPEQRSRLSHFISQYLQSGTKPLRRSLRLSRSANYSSIGWRRGASQRQDAAPAHGRILTLSGLADFYPIHGVRREEPGMPKEVAAIFWKISQTRFTHSKIHWTQRYYGRAQSALEEDPRVLDDFWRWSRDKMEEIVKEVIGWHPAERPDRMEQLRIKSTSEIESCPHCGHGKSEFILF